MTTEIAVLNRLGVALATDSAVTISSGGKQKVFDTGDKLFELCTSGSDPVGIMINGNMDFLGVPWEILIKSFRESKREVKPRSTKDWLNGVLEYIAAHKVMSDAQEEAYVESIIADEIAIVRRRIFRDFWTSAGSARLSELGHRLIMAHPDAG